MLFSDNGGSIDFYIESFITQIARNRNRQNPSTFGEQRNLNQNLHQHFKVIFDCNQQPQ